MPLPERRRGVSRRRGTGDRNAATPAGPVSDPFAEIARLRELLHAHDELLAFVAHELRAPLHGIQGWAQVLSQALEVDPAVVTRAIGGLQSGVAQQARLVDELLDVSRALDGRIRLERAPHGVASLVREAAGRARAACLSKQVTLRLAPSWPRRPVLVDPLRVAQILDTMLSLALRFTPTGGQVRVSARPAPRAAMRELAIEVQDDGFALPAETLAQVRDPGWAGVPGTGLGLTLARRLAELGEGRLEVEPVFPDRGTRYRLTLPLAPDGSRQDAAGAARTPHRDDPDPRAGTPLAPTSR